MKQTIVDTGALVALLDRADLHHEWAKACFKQLAPPLLTCEAVLAETLHLLEDLPLSVNALARLYTDQIVKVNFEFERHAPTVWRLIQKFSDVPMSFTDACLVRMTELHSDCTMWTTDSDFRVYRRHGRETIPLLIPAS